MYYQNETNDCARAAIRNILILNYHDENMKMIYLEKNIDNFLNIKETLSTYNLDYDGYVVDDLYKFKKINFPLVAQVANGDNFHFVVVKKITLKYVYYLDSDSGDIKVTVKDFLKIFTGKVLIKISNKKNIKNKTNKSFLAIKNIAIYSVLFLIQLTSLLLSFYFMNQANSFPFPLVFLIISAINIIFLNLYNLKVRSEYDRKYLIPYLKKYPNSDDFNYLTKVFDEDIKRINCIYNYLLIVIIGTFLFINNEIKVSLLALISIIISFVIIINKSNIESNIRELKDIEFSFKGKLNEREVDEKLLKRLKKGVSNCMLNNIYPYLIEFIFISLIIAYNMFLDDSSSINNYLFYIFLTFTYTTSLTSLCKEIISNDKIAYNLSQVSNNIYEIIK